MEKGPEQQKPDTRPNWIKNNEVGTGQVEYDSEKIPYTILKKDLEPRLPGFLGYLNGENLFISEEVPEAFRLPQLIHEIIEFTELKGQKGRCVEALKRELETVPEGIKKDYIRYRTDFFARLVEFYKSSNDEDFKTEIKASHEFLRTLDNDNIA